MISTNKSAHIFQLRRRAYDFDACLELGRDFRYPEKFFSRKILIEDIYRRRSRVTSGRDLSHAHAGGTRPMNHSGEPPPSFRARTVYSKAPYKRAFQVRRLTIRPNNAH